MTEPKRLQFTREAQFDRAAADAKARSVPLTLATTTPVDRGDYLEVLSLDAGAIDLSRSPLPLIESHDGSELPIGRVEQLRVERDRLRGLAIFGESTRAIEVLRDVENGTIRGVSVGYRVDGKSVRQTGEQNGVPIMRVGKWMPYEASAVAIPADHASGFYRYEDFKMNDDRNDDAGNRNMDEGQRIKTIIALGDQYSHFVEERDVRDAIDKGLTVEQWKERIMARAETKFTRVTALRMTSREVQQYSLGRALAAAVTGDWRAAGYEREISAELARQCGRVAEGFYVPPDYWRRDFNVGTSTEAGNLVPTALRDDLYVDALRASMQFAGLGVRILSGLTGNIDLPRKSAVSTIGTLTEIGSASETNPTIAKLSLTPKRVGAFVETSKQAIIQAAMAIEGVIRDDLVQGAGVLIESLAIGGNGTAPQPTGIRNTTGIGTVVAGSNGAAPAWSHLVDLESACANANAEANLNAGYLLNAKTRGKYKQTPISTAVTDLCWPVGAVPGPDGYVRLNGYRAAVTNNVPSNLTKGTSSTVCSAAIFASDWSMAVLGLWGAPDITVDPYSLAPQGAVRITLNQFFDFGVRQPACFAKIDDLLSG